MAGHFTQKYLELSPEAQDAMSFNACISIQVHAHMTNRLLSLSAVSAARRNEAKATTYLRIKQGTLTPPLKMGRSSAWPEHEINAINEAIIAGKSDDEIRALVKELEAARTADRERQ